MKLKNTIPYASDRIDFPGEKLLEEQSNVYMYFFKKIFIANKILWLAPTIDVNSHLESCKLDVISSGDN